MAVVATGFFDGVHRGHRKVIDTLLGIAKERGEQSVVLTFWPHPRTVLQQEARELRLLNSLEEKKEILYSLGVDRVEVLPFTRRFATMTAGEYLDSVVKGKYGGTTIVVGYDNRLGCDSVTAEQLAPIAEGLGLNMVKCVPLGDISSTKIRNCLAAGKLDMANEMLSQPYSIRGVVVAGNQLGRTIGCPTANIRCYEPLKIMPMTGAYFTKVRVLGNEYNSMTNVGAGEKIETNIFGFNEDIYGLDIEVSFMKYMRTEMTFDSMDALKAQLEIDRLSCQNIIFGI
ncbi:MAG: riboflavin biosynthesis protein RibF [Bacteroidales bacterium]|nr:riboflavin biosynthesis protein RibF [Bacteroidales bacterium]